MPEWIEVIILGIIEGITEFLPISSTGHMILAQQWLTHRQSDLFLIVIQSGAVAAVLLIFQERLKQLIFRWKEPEAQDYLFKLATAFGITCVGGLALKMMHFELPETPVPVAWALLIGGIGFLWVEWHLRGKQLHSNITWTIAAVIGAGQLLAAIFPGTSRSGSTILLALLLGLRRQPAIEFTFLLGVPTLLAASALELLGYFKSENPPPIDWGMLALGALISAVVAFIAVKWLLRYVQSHTFVGFGWYRIILAALIFLYWWSGGFSQPPIPQ